MAALKEFITQATRLPSPPAIALKILEAVRSNEINFEELADIIMVDPVLTAQVLKIANSSIYSLPKQVTSLSQATGLLGTQTLKNIALSFVIVDSFKDIPQGGFDLDLYWKRSISTAVSAKTLAKKTGIADEDIFITALLQDIGILIFFLADAPAFTEMLDKNRITGKRFYEAEKDQFGFDHTELGSHLLKSWNMPETIYNPIRYHHTSDTFDSQHGPAQLLNISDKISSIYHSSQANKKFAEVHNSLAKDFGMEHEQIDELIDSIGEKAREVMDLFAVDPGEMKPFSQLMQEANDELRRLNFSYEQVVLELKQAKQTAEQLALNLKEANDKLRKLAFRDDLTGLYNHRYFQEILEAEIQRSIRYNHPVSLLLLDVDFFKRVNDTYGHPAGDHVLRQISLKMAKLVRHCDIVARYGGEEFAIILPEIRKSGAKVLAQRIRRGIEQLQITITSQQLEITVSVGVSSTDDIEGVKDARAALISNADQALYTAKRNGRNRVEI